MVRTQIQLTEDQRRKLRKIAVDQGVSLAELIRRGVDLILEGNERPEREELRARAAAAAGRFRSGEKHVARDHDRYLDRAFSQ